MLHYRLNQHNDRIDYYIHFAPPQVPEFLLTAIFPPPPEPWYGFTKSHPNDSRVSTFVYGFVPLAFSHSDNT